MDSGLALLLCVLAALKKARLFETSRELMASLAGLLATCIAVDAFFIFCEVLTMAYPGAAGAETLALMTSGPTSPFFWFEIVGGLVVPFLVLVFAKNRERTGLVVGASVLVIAGVLCKRCGFCSPRSSCRTWRAPRASCPTAAGRFSAPTHRRCPKC